MQITFDKKSRAQRRVRFLASDGIAQDSIRERTRGAGYGKTFAGHQQQAWLTVQCVADNRKQIERRERQTYDHEPPRQTPQKVDNAGCATQTAVAPVNAPRTYPNNSLSARFVLIAGQFIATNGEARR